MFNVRVRIRVNFRVRVRANPFVLRDGGGALATKKASRRVRVKV